MVVHDIAVETDSRKLLQALEYNTELWLRFACYFLPRRVFVLFCSLSISALMRVVFIKIPAFGYIRRL